MKDKESTFNLSKMRKRLKELFIKRSPTIKPFWDDLFEEIEYQDKKFIKLDWDLIIDYIKGRISFRELVEKRDKLAGDDLI